MFKLQFFNKIFMKIRKFSISLCKYKKVKNKELIEIINKEKENKEENYDDLVLDDEKIFEEYEKDKDNKKILTKFWENLLKAPEDINLRRIRYNHTLNGLLLPSPRFDVG